MIKIKMFSAVFKYCSITLIILPPSLTTSDTEHYFSKLKSAVSDHQLLLQSTTDWLTEKRGWDIACIAAKNGNLPVIEYIGEHKCSILEKINEKNKTIGHIAAEHGHPNITEYFLKKSSRWIYDLGRSCKVRKSLFDLFAEKGYLNCILNTECLYGSDFKRIGRIAANNGHLGIACYMEFCQGSEYHRVLGFKDIIKIAVQKDQKVDPKTMELFGELAERWRWKYPFPDVIQIASSANRTDLIEYLAEKRCACFLPRYGWCGPMRVAFEKNLVNQRFLECLEKENGTIQGYIGDSETTICQLAAEYGRLDVIRFLTEKNSSILEKSSGYCSTPVGMAFYKGYMDIVRYVVRQYPLTVAEYLDFYHKIRGRSAFHFAMVNNVMDMDTLQYVVEKEGAALVTRTDPLSGKTAAHIAAANGNMEFLRYLVKKEPSVLSIADSSGNTMLHILAENHRMSRNEFEFFVCKGASIGTKNRLQQTVGHIAAERGNVELSLYFTEKEPSILSTKDCHGDTMLHILARRVALCKDGLASFVDQGAPIDAKNNEQQTVGHILTNNGRMDLVEYLAKKKPSILNVADKDGDTIPLILARKNAISVENLKFFVKKGASLILKNNKKRNIALLAAINGNLPILQYVMEKEPSVLTGNSSIGDQIVEEAVSRGHSNILKFIAEKKPTLLADRLHILFKLSNSSEVLGVLRCLKAACETKITNWDRRHFENEVLRKALKYDYPNIFQFMEYDVNLMMIDKDEPLIFTTIRRNRSNLFQYLAENRRTNLTALDREGNNILFVAARNHDLKKMRYVLDTLKAPIDIEWRNYEGNTLLHVSVHQALSRVDRACDLKEQSAAAARERKESSSKDSEEESATHQFQKEYQDAMSVMKYLVEEKHACVNALGHNNKTVLHWATSRTNYDVSNYLLDHGADPKLQDADERNF